MLVPKFREYLTEQDVERKNKPITVAIITKSNPNVKKQKAGEAPKKELTVGLIEKLVRKKVLSVLSSIQNTLSSQVKTKIKIL